VDVSGMIEALRALPDAVVLGILFLGSFIEYVVPPVPGDTIVVAGAVLVAAFGWHWAPVLAVVTLGAVIGAAVDFAIGRWLVRSGRIERLGESSRATIDRIVLQMQRRGAVYLAVNRFLPGIRAFFFVAAGLAGLRLPKVLLWSSISALAWNILLVAIGYAVGLHIEDLELFLSRFAIAGWTLIGLIAVVLAYRWFRSSRAARSRSRNHDDDQRSPPRRD
jgi:membrane protein DedA with SNARE-associated domain